MKTRLLTFVTVVAFVLMTGFGTSCSVLHLHGKNPPPGQVKKATGTKSAKPFAPGQQKKKKKN